MENTQMISYYNRLKVLYGIPHLISRDARTLFILESPHIDELLQGVPVAGRSGKTMAQVLFDDHEGLPLGLRLKAEMDKNIGVMNVCPIPMQQSAYEAEKVIALYGELDKERYGPFLELLGKLRTQTKPVYRDDERNRLLEIVLADFRKTLLALSDQPLVLIPCGRTAETFLKAADCQVEGWAVMDNIPHPSFGNWHKKKYSHVIAEVKAHAKM